MDKYDRRVALFSATMYLFGSLLLLLSFPHQLGRADWWYSGFLGGVMLLSGWVGIQRLREAQPPALVVGGILLMAVSGAAALKILIYGEIWP